MTSVRDYIEMAIDLRDKEDVLVPEARRLIGGPFSLKQISDITGVSQRRLKVSYRDHERPGGRLNPAALEDIRDLRYQNEIGQRLDKAAVWRVILGGTSERVLARLIGANITTIRKMMEEK